MTLRTEPFHVKLMFLRIAKIMMADYKASIATLLASIRSGHFPVTQCVADTVVSKTLRSGFRTMPVFSKPEFGQMFGTRFLFRFSMNRLKSLRPHVYATAIAAFISPAEKMPFMFRKRFKNLYNFAYRAFSMSLGNFHGLMVSRKVVR